MEEAKRNLPPLPPNYVSIVDLRERWLKLKQKQSEPQLQPQPEEIGHTAPPLQSQYAEKRIDPSLPANYTTIADFRERLKQKQKQQQEEKGTGQMESGQRPKSQLPSLSAREDQPRSRLEKLENGDHKTECLVHQRENGGRGGSSLNSQPDPNPNPKHCGTPYSRTPRPPSVFLCEVKGRNSRWVPAAGHHLKSAMESRETDCFVSSVTMSRGIEGSGKKAGDRSGEGASRASIAEEPDKKVEKFKEMAEEDRLESKKNREKSKNELKKQKKSNRNAVVKANPKQEETTFAEETAIAIVSVKVIGKGLCAENNNSLEMGRDQLEENEKVKAMVGEGKLRKKNNQQKKNRNDEEKAANHKQEGKKVVVNETAIVTKLAEEKVSQKGNCSENISSLKLRNVKPKPNNREEEIKETAEEEKIETKKKKNRGKKNKKSHKNKYPDEKSNLKLEKKNAAETRTVIAAKSVEVLPKEGSLENISRLNTGRVKPKLNLKEELLKVLEEENTMKKTKQPDKKPNKNSSNELKANPKQDAKKTTEDEKNANTAKSVKVSKNSGCAENTRVIERISNNPKQELAVMSNGDSVTWIEQNPTRLRCSSIEQGESSGRRMNVAMNRPGWRKDGGYGRFQSRVGAKWVMKGDGNVNAAGL